MKSVARFTGLSLLAVTLAAQDVVHLWPGVAPGSENSTQKEVHERYQRMGGEIIRNIVEPTMTVFVPAQGAANGTAMIVCPGGGFQFLSWTNEGTAVAEWLNKLGVTVFVLKYRVSQTGATAGQFQQEMMALFQGFQTDFAAMQKKLLPTAELAADDGRRAVELVRKDAAKWGVNPNRIGMIGFSAGASVAVDATTEYTAASRPDFTALIYGPEIRVGSVRKDAPPLFLLCAADDPIVPPASSQKNYAAWKSAGHSAELHIYDKGGHGFGMTKHGVPVDHWADVFQEWLSGQGLLKAQ